MHMLTPWSFFTHSGMRTPQKLAGPALMLSRFNQEIEQTCDQMLRHWEEMGRMAANTLIPNLKVEERDNAYEFIMQLPDFDEAEIEISVQGNMLTICAEREQEDASPRRDETSNARNRRRTGAARRFQQHGMLNSFFQTVPLPVSVNLDKIEAHFEDGELMLTVPKLSESLKPRVIEINASGRQESNRFRESTKNQRENADGESRSSTRQTTKAA